MATNRYQITNMRKKMQCKEPWKTETPPKHKKNAKMEKTNRQKYPEVFVIWLYH